MGWGGGVRHLILMICFLEYGISCIFHRSDAYKGDYKYWQICNQSKNLVVHFDFYLKLTVLRLILYIILVKPAQEGKPQNILQFIYISCDKYQGQEFHLLLRNIWYKWRSYIFTKTNYSYRNSIVGLVGPKCPMYLF